ncbi:exo-alpha-sialidase [Belliella sp. DSM 111904]|uniref:Exo-alpha-sialidase n=1 Tax=Belliella filtrata TaxID=2923435 RepID=A0ABS9UVQ5_9BACT|nr:exo-alpha-sialidase [Belliella filtrata]MCH7408045.1 exo-alpha-sialidase [Belliella filtrata]
MKAFQFIFYCILLLVLACNKPSQVELKDTNVNEIYFEHKEGVKYGEPYLSKSSKGEIYISWITQESEINSFFYSKFEKGNWTSPKRIASGKDWFVNWADYPQMAVFEDGSLMAVFLEKSSSSTFSYDIKVTISKNGELWSEPFTLHDDETLSEHGFVSLLPWGEDMFVSWLDGRHTSSISSEGHHDHDHAGAMTLRAAVLDTDGAILIEWELDDMVCDCCQTTSTLGENGPIVFFRNRSDEEIRDIYFVSYTGIEWSEPMPVYHDNWNISGCPVNGPQSTSNGSEVAVTWYTAAKDSPIVKTAFFNSESKTFEEPIKIDLGNTIGRVATVMIDQKVALVSWMEKGTIYLRAVRKDGRKSKPILVGEASELRSSGFPQLIFDEKDAILAWTVDNQGLSQIKTVKLPLDSIIF